MVEERRRNSSRRRQLPLGAQLMRRRGLEILIWVRFWSALPNENLGAQSNGNNEPSICAGCVLMIDCGLLLLLALVLLLESCWHREAVAN